jgi:serine/threonine protein kinase
MNFEEMLEQREVKKTSKIRMPYGYFYKRLIDGKYSNFVQFHDELTEDIFFGHCVKAESDAVASIDHKTQLHFSTNGEDDGVFAIAVEVGNYQTLEQLLNDNPAIVARNEFMSATLKTLFDFTAFLNSKGIYHVCFAPSNILMRKTDNAVRLLCHGSFYKKVDVDLLYEGVEDYIAPEVFDRGEIDARTDVYSLGKLISYLYNSAGMPFELKPVIKKATDADPDKRYASVEDFEAAINRAQTLKRTGLLGAAALAIALTIVGLFFYTLPSPDDMEYVKPIEEPVPDEMIEEDMDALLGIGADTDSATIAQIVKQQQHMKDSLGLSEGKMREYKSKAEEIFRKQFTKAAEQIISKVYNKDQMNGSEKDFTINAQKMTNELVSKKDEIMKSTAISTDRAEAIADKIIEQLTEKKKAELDKDYYGIKKQKNNNEK